MLDCLVGFRLDVACLDGSLGPALTNAAIDLSRSPPVRFRTVIFLSLSLNPISCN